jgi:hypothetical protein
MKTVDHSFSLGIAGSRWMDHGGKRLNRGRHLCKTNEVDAAFCVSIRIVCYTFWSLQLMVPNEKNCNQSLKNFTW